MRIRGRLLRRERVKRFHYGREFLTLTFLAVFFLLGSIAGSIVGTGQLSAREAVFLKGESIYGYDSFIGLFLSCCKYHLVTLLFASSLLGVFLIPLTMAFRGFVLSCTVASITATYPEHSFGIIALVLGLPAAFTVPGLFIVGFEGMFFSEKLIALYSRRPLRPEYCVQRNRIIFAFVLVAAAALAEMIIVPTFLRFLL